MTAPSQTRIDVHTQAKPMGAAGVSVDSRQGSGGKFQMSGGAPVQPEQIAIYDSDGNLLSAQCTIRSGTLSCGDGTTMSTISLGELKTNGNDAFVIHGAADQGGDACIVLSGQPESSQFLRATAETVIDDEGRACAVMVWVTSQEITNLNQIPSRNYGDLQGVPTAFPPAVHAAAHGHGGTDEIGASTPQANAIPKSGSDGRLNPGWLPAPGAETRGGVEAKDCAITNQFVQKINTDASVTCAAPPVSGEGGGIVSVGLAMPAEFNVIGSPITTGGTITVARTNQAANTVFAAPASGPAGPPVFRVLAAADFPAQTFFQSQAVNRDGSLPLGTANQVRVMSFHLPYKVTASTIMFSVSVVDSASCTNGANCYAVGIYTESGTLVAHTGPISMTIGGMTSAALTSTVTIEPGRYLFAFTGSAAVARLQISSSTTAFVQPWNQVFMPETSSGGNLPGAITPGVPNWTLGPYPYFILR